MMTPRERVLTAMKRQVPDKVPRRLEYGSFIKPLWEIFYQKTGATDPEEYFTYEIRNVGFKPTGKHRKKELSKYLPENLEENCFIDLEWGNINEKGHQENVYRIVQCALENAETVYDIDEYPMPDILSNYRWEHVKDKTTELHRRNLAVMGFMSQTIFEVAWGVRGFENFLADMYINQEMTNLLVSKITDIRCSQARIFAEANVDVLRLGDDVGTERAMMISPEMFRKWLKPGYIKIINAAKEVNPDILIFFHSDGDCQEIIPDLIEIGTDILNPVQPECMDPAEIKKQYGDKLAFWGTIGTQTTMPFGTPDDVRQAVKERIETVGAGGGLLLSPTHLLQVETPWENIIAFFDAVDEFGYY